MSDTQGVVEQCKPPWHTVDCYLGKTFCGETGDPPWQPILEIVKEFSLAHMRNDMPAVTETWERLNRALGAHDAEDARLRELLRQWVER